MKLKLSKSCSSRGADMGRNSIIPNVVNGFKLKLHLERMPLDSGGYDNGGAYWGFPSDLYCAWQEPTPIKTFITVRADNRTEAKIRVLEVAPWATFYR